MRILSDTPNLDFLRREAKDLLIALRERDPAIRLAAAQREVADQYGFRSWPELKVEVERRRATPPSPDPTLAPELAAAFGLGSVTGAMSPMAYTIMGRRWRLQTDRGAWLATPVFDWIDEGQTERATELRERARAGGVIAPVAVRTRDGALLHRSEDRAWRVDEWIDFGPEVLQPVRSSVARGVGRTLATIHAVGMPSPDVLTPGGSGHLTFRRSEEDWARLIDRTAAAGKPWAEELRALRTEVLVQLEAIPFVPAQDPLIVCINDLSTGVVRMGPDDGLVLTHWDFAGANHPAWELAYVLVHWAGHPPVNPGTARALVAGYRDRAGAVPPLAEPSFWLAITANLNWTYNQFCFGLDRTGENQAYAEGELRDLLATPLSVPMINGILAELE